MNELSIAWLIKLNCSTNNFCFYIQIVNLTAIIIYRTGYGGSFLGIGGTWNLNEEKSPDAEIVASGILVGYFIYTSVQVIAYFFREDKEHRELSDTIMNVVGVLLWVGVGATALHYWVGYMPDYDMLVVTSERTVGSLRFLKK